MKERQVFYVQREPRSVWHVESEDDPELMLCGEVISVDAEDSKVQKRPGPKFCLWCERYLTERSSVQSSESPSPTTRNSSALSLTTTLRDVTTPTGPITLASSSPGSATPTGSSPEDG